MKTKFKVLLNMTVGSFLLLSSTGLNANAVWQAAATDLGATASWSGSTLPTPSTTAEFPVGGGANPTTTTGPLQTLGILIDAGAASYSFDITDTNTTIGAGGVVNHSVNPSIIGTTGAGVVTFTTAATSDLGVEYFGNNTGGFVFAGPVTILDLFQLNNTANLTTVSGASSVGELDGAPGTTILLSGSSSLTEGSLNTGSLFEGTIGGTGSFIKVGDGVFVFDNVNTYTGGTIINAGVTGGITLTGLGALASTGNLAVNTGTFDITGITNTPQVIGSLSGTGAGVIALGTKGIEIVQAISETYAGIFTGAGANITIGAGNGLLRLTGDSSAFNGLTTIDQGGLQVDGSLGGYFTVSLGAGGLLAGNGSISTLGESTTINNVGFLVPGSFNASNNFVTPGTLTINGSLTFNTGSIFLLAENGATIGQALVGQTTTLNGGVVIVVPSNAANVINFNSTLPFITSTDPLAGEFQNLLVSHQYTPALYHAFLSYDPNHAFITIDTTFAKAVAADGADSNAIAAAAALDSIIDPNLAQNTLLSELAQLTVDELVVVLDDASGSQYTTEVFAGELANRQFIRRLYDPIRDLVTTEPCNLCCAPVDPCCEFLGFDVWATSGGGQSRINGHSGYKYDEWDVTLGLQKTFCDDLTFGIAGSYEHDTINYRLNGSGKGHSWFGGVYGLYRPSCYYLLADVAYGYTEHKVHRTVTIDTVINELNAKPQFSQVTFYGEAGFDWNVRSFLVQPFLGLEVAGFNRKAFTETEVLPSDLALSVHKKDRTNVTGSLGAHLTNHFWSGFSISVDLAWLHRFTNNNSFDVNFVSLGDDFTVFGPNVGRDSGEGAVTFARDFGNWRVFVEASGEVWNKASTYNLLGGVQVTW